MQGQLRQIYDRFDDALQAQVPFEEFERVVVEHVDRLSFWGIALILSALILSGCGSTKAQSAVARAPVVLEVPEGVHVARDAALTYMAENYAGQAPAAGLAWTEKHTKPEGQVGGESYEYTAGHWVIAVSYPVVAPENSLHHPGEQPDHGLSLGGPGGRSGSGQRDVVRRIAILVPDPVGFVER